MLLGASLHLPLLFGEVSHPLLASKPTSTRCGGALQRGFAPLGAPRPFAMEQFARELGSAPCGQRPLPASPIKVGRNIPFLAHGALGKKELPYPSHLYLIPNKATFLVPFHPSYPSRSCCENSPVLFAVPGGRLCLSGCCRDGQQNPPKFSRHPEGWQEMGKADSEPKQSPSVTELSAPHPCAVLLARLGRAPAPREGGNPK